MRLTCAFAGDVAIHLEGLLLTCRQGNIHNRHSHNNTNRLNMLNPPIHSSNTHNNMLREAISPSL